jgi:AraC-like DNA-binding protein
MKQASGWVGRVQLSGARGLYLGSAGTTALHAIHAVKIAVALEQPFVVRDESGAARRATSIVVGPEQAHAIDGGGSPIALFYFLPEADESVGVSRQLAGTAIRSLPPALERRLREPLRHCLERERSLDLLDEFADEIVEELRPIGLSARLDRRIARILESMWHNENASRLPDLAQLARLSEDRLTHLFREQTGTSIKHYQLWVRFRRSLARMESSRSLTDVAHGVGFADAAHFSRTFRGMLGVVPSDLHQRVAFADAFSFERRARE